jgi:hypothetical protein
MDGITFTNAPILVGLIIISLTLVRLVEALVMRRINKRNGTSMNPGNPGPRGLTDAEHNALIRLDEAHAKYDIDGTPLWYIPRSWMDTQGQITKTLSKMTETLTTISGTQKAIVRTLDRMEDASRQVDLPRRKH